MVCITEDKIIINDYIENDPLSDKNLDNTLETIHRIRLLFPNKSIWLYTGYTWESIVYSRMPHPPKHSPEEFLHWNQRMEIISKCDILVDGQYIDSQRDITLRWKGSKNQRVIDCKKSLQKNEIVLHCN